MLFSTVTCDTSLRVCVEAYAWTQMTRRCETLEIMMSKAGITYLKLDRLLKCRRIAPTAYIPLFFKISVKALNEVKLPAAKSGGDADPRHQDRSLHKLWMRSQKFLLNGWLTSHRLRPLPLCVGSKYPGAAKLYTTVPDTFGKR